jgi:hypothetical protein
MKRRMLLTLACLAFAFASAAGARDTDRWLSLGQRTLDPRGERVEIRLGGRGTIEALVLGVDNAAVRILDVKVELGNGRVVDWPVRGVLYPGQRTHVFDLSGPFERRVRKVIVLYETGHSGRRGHKGPERRWEPDRDRQWERNWDRDWDRDYGRLKPVITVWGHN